MSLRREPSQSGAHSSVGRLVLEGLGAAVISALVSALVAWLITGWQLDAAEEMARKDRLADHIAALEGFRQTVRILGDVLDDQTAPGLDAAQEGSQAITDAMMSVQVYALQVRATANAGDLVGVDSLEDCDDALRRSADALLSIRTTAPLSWQDINDGYVDDAAPHEVTGIEGSVDNIDSQIDLLMAAVAAQIDGIKGLIREDDPLGAACDGLYPSPVD